LSKKYFRAGQQYSRIHAEHHPFSLFSQPFDGGSSNIPTVLHRNVTFERLLHTIPPSLIGDGRHKTGMHSQDS
jgi:hypothetical protein